MLDELRAVYRSVDAALEGATCDASTDCCRFGVTGREPYPTAIELAELDRAVKARGGIPKRRVLPIASERRCALLGDSGKCLVYASRPFGCRTFFCERGRDSVGPLVLPKATIQEHARAIVDLAQRFAPGDPGPRPLSRAAAARGWDDRRK